MKSKLFSCFFLLLAMAPSCVQQENKWFEYKSKDAGFMLDFPFEPKSISQNVNAENMTMTLEILSVDCQKQQNSKNYTYMATYYKYPEKFFDNYTDAIYSQFFENTINGMVNSSVDGKLIDKQIITFNNFPGRQIRMKVNNGAAIITARFILANKTMYILHVTTDASKDKNSDVDKFLNSFKLIDL